jgi:hypothetical protein
LNQGGKWPQAQGETGLDVVGRLAKPRHPWFADVDAQCRTVILGGERGIAPNPEV